MHRQCDQRRRVSPRSAITLQHSSRRRVGLHGGQRSSRSFRCFSWRGLLVTVSSRPPRRRLLGIALSFRLAPAVSLSLRSRNPSRSPALPVVAAPRGVAPARAAGPVSHAHSSRRTSRLAPVALVLLTGAMGGALRRGVPRLRLRWGRAREPGCGRCASRLSLTPPARPLFRTLTTRRSRALCCALADRPWLGVGASWLTPRPGGAGYAAHRPVLFVSWWPSSRATRGTPPASFCCARRPPVGCGAIGRWRSQRAGPSRLVPGGRLRGPGVRSGERNPAASPVGVRACRLAARPAGRPRPAPRRSCWRRESPPAARAGSPAPSSRTGGVSSCCALSCDRLTCVFLPSPSAAPALPPAGWGDSRVLAPVHRASHRAWARIPIASSRLARSITTTAPASWRPMARGCLSARPTRASRPASFEYHLRGPLAPALPRSPASRLRRTLPGPPSSLRT